MVEQKFLGDVQQVAGRLVNLRVEIRLDGSWISAALMILEMIRWGHG